MEPAVEYGTTQREHGTMTDHPDFQKSWETGLDEYTFSNGTMFEIFEAYECQGCVHQDLSGEGCALVGVALLGRRPVEWTPGGTHTYTCTRREVN